MERQTSPPVNPAGLANPSSVPPHSGVARESSRGDETATSPMPGASELAFERESPAVVLAPTNTQRPEAIGRNELTAQLLQPLVPVVQSPVGQTGRNTLAAGPMMAPAPTGPTSARGPFPLPHSTIRPTSVGHSGSSSEKLENVGTLSGMGFPELHRDSALRIDQPLPVLPQAHLVENDVRPTRRQRGLCYGIQSALGRGPDSRRSNLDWMVPDDDKSPRTVKERLTPTLKVALDERDKSAAKAKSTTWALNTAIGLQVLFGSITTGLSAVGTTGRSTAVQTTIFGALSTMLASYLAKARGSKEPDLSIARVSDLEHFIRDISAFLLDHGHVDTEEWDGRIDDFRGRLEEILEGGPGRGPSAA